MRYKMKKKNNLKRIGRTSLAGRKVNAPVRKSFEEFLVGDARVPTGHGEHGAYSFAGREALLEIVRLIDEVVGGGRRPPLQGRV